MTECPTCAAASPAPRIVYQCAQGIGTCHKHASPYYQDAARRAEQKRREARLRADLVYEGEMVEIRRLENRKARVAAPQGEGNTDE